MNAAAENETKVQQPAGLLGNKVYVRVYSAFAVATFGDWFDTLAIQVLVGYRWQVSPLMLALIPVAVALPGILLGSFAGVAADRMNKLSIMRICDLVTAALTVLILLAPSMVWLLPLLALRAAVSTLNVPAQQSLTRSIVRPDQLLQATSLNGLVNQGSKIAGPLLGGVALSVLSPHWCILLNACLRACSYLLLLTVKKMQTGEQSHEAAAQENNIPFRMMWKEGWSFILRSRLLLTTLVYGLIGSLAIQMIDFQFTSLFRILAPQEESMLGWMVAAAGAGAVLIILLMNRMNRAAGYGWKLGVGDMLIGAAVAGLGLLQPGITVIPVVLLGFLLGIGNGMFIITFNYCLQKETPPHMTGRVFGIQSTIHSAIMIGAPLLGGIMVGLAGPGRVFINFGIVIALIGILGLLFRRLLWPEGKAATPADELANLI